MNKKKSKKNTVGIFFRNLDPAQKTRPLLEVEFELSSDLQKNQEQVVYIIGDRQKRKNGR